MTPEEPSPVPGESPGTGREGLDVLGLIFSGLLVDFQCLMALPGPSTCANPLPCPCERREGGREDSESAWPQQQGRAAVP